MVGISLALTICLWLAGAKMTAMAGIAVLPLSLFHSWLTRSAIMKGGSSSQVVLRTLIRTVLAVVALAVASYFGTEVLLGVLLGLSLEVMTHLVYGVQMLLRR